MLSRIDRAHSRNGASTLSPDSEEASKKCTSVQVRSVSDNNRTRKFKKDTPFSAAHLLASAHSTSLSSSRSDLFPTKTTTRFGLPSARASASHRDRFRNEARLDGTVTCLYCPRNHTSIPCDVVYQDCPSSASIIAAGNRSVTDKD